MKKHWSLILLIALLAVLPWVMYPIFLMKVICFALFACAFNLLLGYTGLLSFGHAMFFGGAAYITGYVMTSMGLPVEVGLLAATGFGALTGLIVGALAIRRQGIYFTMITLALAQMAYFLFLQARFTGGEEGLQGVARGQLFGFIDLKNDMVLYYVLSLIFLACLVFIIRVVNSPFGQVLTAIKDNEPRAVSLGYRADIYKLLVFVLSAALSGLAGGLKVVVLGFATLTDVYWAMSGLVVLMTLVGGVGTMMGPIVGALIVLLLENKLVDLGSWLASLTGIEWFSALGENVSIAIGLIFVLCVLTFRRGIIGELEAYSKRAAVAST